MTKIGHEGLNNLLAAYPDKSAKAICTFGYSPGPGQEPILFQGVTDVCLEVGQPQLYCSEADVECRARLSRQEDRLALVRTAISNLALPYRQTTNYSQGWDPIFEHEGQT